MSHTKTFLLWFWSNHFLLAMLSFAFVLRLLREQTPQLFIAVLRLCHVLYY